MITPTAADIKRARAITLCSEKCDPQLCWLHETTEKIAQALADERERAAVIAKKAHPDDGACCFEDPDGHAGRVSMCDQIADAIRSQA